MKARIIITPDGQLSAFIDEGTFEEGKQKLTKLMDDLKALGIKIEDEGQVEQHRHDHEHVHTHAHQEAHN